MFRTIFKKHSEEIFLDSTKEYACCAYCKKIVSQSDKYCQYCGRVNETLPAEVVRIKSREFTAVPFGEEELKRIDRTIAWKANIMYDPTPQIKKEDIQKALRKIQEAMDMRSGGGAPGLKHPIPCPEKKGQRGGEEVDRRERHRRELGISTSKLNDMVERIYELMCENEVTLVEGREILVEVGRIISEAERRSPNTRLSEIPRS